MTEEQVKEMEFGLKEEEEEDEKVSKETKDAVTVESDAELARFRAKVNNSVGKIQMENKSKARRE